MATVTDWKLNNNRYCILGLPRCGSHWLESIISHKLNATVLGEYFHWWSSRYSRFRLDKGYLIPDNERSEIDPFLEMERRRTFLREANPSQAMVARLFMLDNWFWDYEKVAEELLKNGFEFVYLKRDFEDQLISYYFSKEENKWSRSLFENELTVDIEKLKKYVFSFCKFRKDGESWLKNIPHTVIEYESLSSNQEEAGGNFKMMPEDPYKLIKNKDQVKEIFTVFYPRVQKLLEEV